MNKVQVSVLEHSPVLNPVELSEFLYLLRGTVVGLGVVSPQLISTIGPSAIAPAEAEIRQHVARLRTIPPGSINDLFAADYQPEAMQIEDISRHSPLEITLLGCVSLIVIAVILSGGELEAGALSARVKAKLPSLGSGIKALKEALGFGRKLQVGYGLHEITIKLTPEQLKLLIMPIKGEGGFQSLLRGLQYRVNHHTREITLTREEVERIYRYKQFPDKGGFQARFLKIFAPHFPGHRARPELEDGVVEV